MKVRRGTHTDVPAIVDLLQEFYAQSKYAEAGIKLGRATATNLVTSLLGQSGIVSVAEDDGVVVGFVLVAVFPFHFNPKHLVATELAFYVSPSAHGRGAGKQLMKKAEQVATQMGVRLLSFVAHEHVDSSAAHRIYENSGYQKTEVAYVKEL